MGIRSEEKGMLMLRLENGFVNRLSNIRAPHVLQILIRDNARELKSADLNAYVESLGVKDYFSVAYDQNEPAESTINSLMIEPNTKGPVGINGRILVSSSY